MPKKPTPNALIAEALLIDKNPTSYNTVFKDGALEQVASRINSHGLPLLMAHDTSKFPVGAWFEADIRDSAVYSKFFIPQEVPEYHDIKPRLETGILDSVSIGFSADVHECSICGNDIYDFENCDHIPGKTYEGQTCYVMLDNIHPSEGSLVYSGAVRNAKIVDTDSKADYFAKNELNFSDGQLEIVQHKCTYHICNETNNEGENMPEEEYQELQTKFSELQEKFTTAREELVATKESLVEFKEKAAKYDQVAEELDKVKQDYQALVAKFKEKAEALAAPFDQEYKAPEDIDSLVADIDKYIEKAKALPSGQQSSSEEEEIEFSVPEDAYKV